MATRLNHAELERRQLNRDLRAALKAAKALTRELPALLARTRRIVKSGDGRYPTACACKDRYSKQCATDRGLPYGSCRCACHSI